MAKRRLDAWSAVLASFALAASAAVLVLAPGCSAGGGADAPVGQLRGVYRPETRGAIGALAIADDGSYVFRDGSCHDASCTEVGVSSLDASGTTLTLTEAHTGARRTFRVEVLATTPSIVSSSDLAPRNLVGQGDLVDGGDDKLVDGGAKLADGGEKLLDTVTEAKLNGDPVKLVDADASGDAGTDNGNDTNPPWPGIIPGVAPLNAPADGEQDVFHPTGNAVTIATPGDKAFADDATLAAKYDGVANVYNSHGTPGTLYGGVPDDEVRQFLNDSDEPLIVASCFSGAPMTGGSTIRRLVSAYADDPLVASRVYGCTGFAFGDATDGIGCSGTWVNANGTAVPAAERTRLQLYQYQCSTNTLVDDHVVFDDCANAD